MRVIAGIAKGQKLLNFKNPLTKPTENRIKEAMFSIIQFKISNTKVLDLFAGTGQIAIEFLSRGADFCTLVDKSLQAHKIQKENLKLTGFLNKSEIILNDCIKFLKKTKDRFDFIFIDPPYNSNLILPTLQLAQTKLKTGSLIICEHDSKIKMPLDFYHIKLQKQYSYGKIKLTFYCEKESDKNE